MENQTQRKTTNNNDNQEQIQTQDNKLLSPKTSVLIRARLRAQHNKCDLSKRVFDVR